MRTQQGIRVGVSKREIVGERKDLVVDPVRVAGAGMGGAAAAWGIPRIGMVGSALDRGVKSTAPGTASRAREVKGLVGAARRITSPVGRTTEAVLGKIPEGRYLMRLTPEKLRPGIAAVGGGYLLSRATPVHQVRTREVVR